MPTVRFGTDGVRGVANAELTAEIAVAIGRAAALVLSPSTFLIGRDTRRSGPLLQAALASGLASGGADVIDVGVLPTPGVAYLAEQRGLPAAVVSASHNPFADNGIKLLGPGGTKLGPGTETAIETEIEAVLDGRGSVAPTGSSVGELTVDSVGTVEYSRHLETSIAATSLKGLSVVLDCAHGAATVIAPQVFSYLGANVTSIGAEPDGVNVNAGVGSTNPEALVAKVIESGADLGLAFDGDADRLVAVDHHGKVANGDVLLALFATDLAAEGALAGMGVVTTVMTNLGFRMAMARRGINVIETPVGDRHVSAAMEAHGYVLGGEQSGHIVFSQRATTGDGVLTGLLLADLIARAGRPLAELTDGLVVVVPQILVNVKVDDPARLDKASRVWKVVDEIERELGHDGRVVLRASGTEPVVRVMVEARDQATAASASARLCRVVENALGPDRSDR